MDPMDPSRSDGPELDLLLEVVRRGSAFEAFERSVADKRELAAALSVSRATAHRIIRSFESHGFIARTDGCYELTPLGEIVGDAGRRFHEDVATAVDLEVLLRALPDEVAFDHRLFADAVVTRATYDDPYRPMKRFIDLFEGAPQIRAFNKSFLEPMYIDIAHEQLLAGMDAEIVYEPGVLELVTAEYPDIAAEVFELDTMASYVHEDLPIALAVFDDRVGLGVHTEEMGTPIAWIDTDDPDAIAWGIDLFERYRTTATRLG